MNIEAEYKYIVDKIPKENAVKKDIMQFYIQPTRELKKLLNVQFDEKICTARVRIENLKDNQKYILTLKTDGIFKREEYEKEIDANFAKKLLKNPISFINKTRYVVNVDGIKFEFDEYKGHLKGLKTCEIEVQNNNISQFEIEKYFENYFKIKFENVTFDKKYLNSNLAKKIKKNLETKEKMKQKQIDNIIEWCYKNLDLVEELKEENKKPVILIAGASSSGKSYSAGILKQFLIENGYNPLVLSTDNYNIGNSAIVFNKVNQKYFDGLIPNANEVLKIIQEVTTNIEFSQKFDEKALKIIKNKCKNLISASFLNKFVKLLKFEFDHINFDEKSVYDLDAVADDLNKLCKNQIIEKREHTKLTGEQVFPRKKIDGKNFDVVIVEGIYALSDEIIKKIEENSIKNYIDSNGKSLFLRRIIRDSKITKCGNAFTIKAYLGNVMTEFLRNILPTKQKANLVFKNNMEYKELRNGETTTTQKKYYVSKETAEKYIKNGKILSQDYIHDTFFSSPDENQENVLRLREASKDGINFGMIELTHKGIAKERFDGKLIRPTNVLADKKTLNEVFSSKEELLASFSRAGISVFNEIVKFRTKVLINGKIFAVDDFGDKFVIELQDEEKQLEKSFEKDM